MNRLFIPTLGPTDWRRLLADPGKQWRETKSAWEAAVSWEGARATPRGLPSEVADLFDLYPEFQGASLLFGVPEHQVVLDGGGHASQTDFWALLSTPVGVVSVSVEAKAGESFDQTVRKWIANPPKGSGKPRRLKQLCSILQLTEEQSHDCRYQLLHRSVSAILEAQRFQLSTALFLVQAFGDNTSSFDDYCVWAKLLGVSPVENSIHNVGLRSGVTLWIGWLSVMPANERRVRSAV